MRIEKDICIQQRRIRMVIVLVMVGFLLLVCPLAFANHRGSDGHGPTESFDIDAAVGHRIPGASFRVYWFERQAVDEILVDTESKISDTIHTVIDAFSLMVKQRAVYARFDEALKKEVLSNVIIEPRVLNRDGKEFLLLVARTQSPGQVRLLVNASMLFDQGLVNQPGRLVPLLAREFQWVVSKAETSQKRRAANTERNLTNVPIQQNVVIANATGMERHAMLQALLASYLTTVDDYESLAHQSYYEIGSDSPISDVPRQSAMRLYDIRVRASLLRIVSDLSFLERTPLAVRSLLNGKIWNVSFVHIDSRDWAMRTRVLPKDKAVKVGKKIIQPAKVLINLHRTAVPDNPYYALTYGLPMGALSTDQLAQAIALEIEAQIIEKSMRGHVAEDARTTNH